VQQCLAKSEEHIMARKQKIEIKENGIFVGGKLIQMISGEFHYWRVPPDAWDSIFDAMKKLGFAMVATYIPWDFHEIKKGTFDFTGKTSEHKNLKKWLELCSKHKMSVIIRPGPYIYAEWNYGGPPEYVVKYPRLSKEFLAHSEVWIKSISVFLKPYLVTQGGSIVLLQPCNEVTGSYENSPDARSDKILDIYKSYCKEKFSSINELNASTHKNYKDFSKITIPDIPSAWGGCCFRDIDLSHLPTTLAECKLFIEFGKWYTEKYLKYVADLYKKSGIDVPIIVNLVGWYWPQNFERLEKILDLTSMDTYYQNMLPGDLYCAFTKLYKIYSRISKFPTAVEFQCGVWDPMIKQIGVMSERHFYYTSLVAIASGLKGINYYMLVNRDNWYFAPINEWGKIRVAAQKVVQRTTSVMKKLSIENLERTTSLGIAWYAPHTEHFLFTGKKQVHLEYKHKEISKMPFNEDYPHVWNIYRSMTNYGFDLDIVSITDDKEFPPYLIYSGYPFMEWPIAEKLYKYVASGGKLIVFGSLPEVDISGEMKYDLFKDLLKNLRTYKAKGVFSIKIGKGAIYYAPEDGSTNYRTFFKEVGYTEDICSAIPGIFTSMHVDKKTKKNILFVINNNFVKKECKLTVSRMCKFTRLTDIEDKKKYLLRDTLTIDKKDVRVFYLS